MIHIFRFSKYESLIATIPVKIFIVLILFFSQEIQATEEVGVEVKVSIPPYQISKALKTLRLTPDEGGERSIYFYDTPRSTKMVLFYALGK